MSEAKYKGKTREQMNIWDKFGEWRFIKKIEFLLWKLNAKSRIKRWLYCRRKYHRLISHHLWVRRKRSGERMRTVINVHYLCCPYCDKMFFASKKDNDKYVKYKKDERSEMIDLAKLNKKQYKKLLPKSMYKPKEFG